MRRDEYGRTLPCRPSWTLRKMAGDPHGLLRYDVVYVRATEDTTGGYVFVRFWPTGHYLEKRVLELVPDEIDSFHNSIIGFYAARSANEILAETFWDLNFGQYHYTKYCLDKNGDLLKVSSGPLLTWWHYKYPEPIRYTPHYVGELKLQPDW
jgi:hypothetical protein